MFQTLLGYTITQQSPKIWLGSQAHFSTWEGGMRSVATGHHTYHPVWLLCNILTLPYTGKLSRERTFMNFVVLWLFLKVFSAKFGSVISLMQHKRAICESFLRENRIFHQFAQVFSLESFLLYGILVGWGLWLCVWLLCNILTLSPKCLLT